MNLTAALLSPFTLLISLVGGQEGQSVATSGRVDLANTPSFKHKFGPVSQTRSSFVFEPDVAAQVKIEQRMTIRVAPRGATPPPREMFSIMPEPRSRPRAPERKIGKCLPAASVVGVEPNGPNHLVLFLRDRRMINAELEHSCPANSFYSGFYLSRSVDGNLCVDRDTLLSRSGSACKILRIRQLPNSN